MRILIATSEIHPYSKTGGLADMVAALAKTLARKGHQVGVVTPLYKGLLNKFPDIKPMDWKFDVSIGKSNVAGGLHSLSPEENLTVYFVDHREFFWRDGLYTERGYDYPDNFVRFLFFSQCVVNLAQYLDWKPEVVHGHDWPTGLVSALIRHRAETGEWENPSPVCFTIHNLAYQGYYPKETIHLTGLPWSYFTPEGLECYDQVNCLKAGIAYSDVITTVSPRYAREIMTEAQGCGLDGLLRIRQADLVGILNGVDYEEWKTTENPHINRSYSPKSLAGKAGCKKALQKEVGLPIRSDVPLFGSVTRLAEQKGVDIQLVALEQMIEERDFQFVLLGTGDPRYEKAYSELAEQFPTKVAVKLAYDHGLAHRIEAGCDYFLMPSRFEPCGLNQMYSLRYATIPVVRATGGLDDSVTDISEDLTNANGIKFYDYTPAALEKGIRKALALYDAKELFRIYRRNAMAVDFSLEYTAEQYLEVYEKMLAAPRALPVPPLPDSLPVKPS